MFNRRSILKLAAVPLLPPIPLTAGHGWSFVIPGVASVPLTKMTVEGNAVVMKGFYKLERFQAPTLCESPYIARCGVRVFQERWPLPLFAEGDQLTLTWKLECTGVNPHHVLKMIQSGLNPIAMTKAEFCEWLVAKGLPVPEVLSASKPGIGEYA